MDSNSGIIQWFYQFAYIVFGDGRYQFLIRGLIFVLKVTVLATCIGFIIGVILAIFRMSNDLVKETRFKKLAPFNPLYWVATFYISVIRGTPLLVQIMLINNFVFVGSLKDTPLEIIASISVGINSAAYIAEIIRSGINGLDKGQMEASRALGMPYLMAMQLVVLPQAFKNMIPTLVNEFIVLIKETSIVKFIGGFDLLKAAEKITSITYKGLEPLLAVAIMYFILTGSFTLGMRYVERNVRKSD